MLVGGGEHTTHCALQLSNTPSCGRDEISTHEVRKLLGSTPTADSGMTPI